MYFKSIIMFFIVCSSFLYAQDEEENTGPINPIQSNNPPCTEKGKCKKGAPYKCYCSRVCGYRDIQEDDDPVWHEGICYCKEWDKRHYYDRCIAE